MKRISYIKRVWPVRFIVLLTILCTSSLLAFSQNTENKAARQYAADFFNSRQQHKTGLKSEVIESSLTQSYQSSENVKTPLFVFQQTNNGFAMIAQSHNTFKIVGYSDNEDFQTENIPPQLRALMTFYEDSLHFINPVSTPLKGGNPIVPALLYEHNIRLNQFNHPEVGGSYTGCMATAMTQILLFHAAEQNKQIEGYGSHCYEYYPYGEICADFENTTYDSDELLSYHVAISMDMRFTTGGSSPPSMSIGKSMEEYFHYFVKGSIKDDFYLKNELENRRPVFAAISGLPENHAIVFDGYDDQGYFHLNFGWGGISNGYYLMNNGTWFGAGGAKFFTSPYALFLVTPTPPRVTEQDSLALVAVHNAIGGYEVTNWDLTKPVWTWPGVLTMNDRVIRLTVNSSIPSTLQQSIAPEIGNLTALQELSFGGCLNGNIPSTITKLTDLKKLVISNSIVYIAPTVYKGNLKCELPADIDKLTKLEWLSLYNASAGTIPASIGNLTNLKILSISQDTSQFGKGNLTGPIPDEIGNLSKLNQLNLSNQNINGDIPSTINNLTELRELVLYGNQLSGSVPAMNLPNLGYLKLNDNLFSEIDEGNGNCPNLILIELQNNQIAGNIPSYFGNFTALKSLNLYDNKIESLPEEVGNLIQLERLVVDYNQLQALPNGLALNLRLKEFSASNNQIAYIPSNFGQSLSLETLDLSYNQITTIPEEIGNCPNLYQIILNNNSIDSIPATFANTRDGATILLHDNEMQGKIPEKLMTSTGHLRLDYNRYVYDDIPKSDELRSGVRNQKDVLLEKQTYKVQIGDTVSIDIRTISNLRHPDNEYYWIKYPEFIAFHIEDERLDAFSSNPILDIIIDEETIKNKYCCQVFNPNIPSYSFEYSGSTHTTPCMDYLNTDTIVFTLASDEELISEEYTDEFVTSLEEIPNKTISDGVITLVPPLKIRGQVQWEASADGDTWETISEQMEAADLWANVKSVSNKVLVLAPKNTAYYRCSLHDTDCDPIYSDKLKVQALGNVLFDDIINVTEEARTIDVDSIEVVVPINFHDSDFRLTITKLENPPAAPDSVIVGSAYDVTVSFADEFEIPLLIKLKNIDKTKIKEKDIDKFKAVYFDDQKQQWEIDDLSGINLKDSTIEFFTNHLTKLAWFELAHGSYTHIHTRSRVNIIYKYGVGNEHILYRIYENYIKNLPNETWHTSNTDPDNGGTPYMIQDIGEYMDQIIIKYASLGLETPSLRFNVYVGDLGNSAQAKIDASGYLAGRGYFYIDPIYYIKDRDNMRRTLAHEYTHYTQDYYMTVLLKNYFWMEATAPLGARLVWNESKLEKTEPEMLLKEARVKSPDSKSIFEILSKSWDESSTFPIIEKFMVNSSDANISGAFLHYMQSYRDGSEKLDLATLLKETPWFSGWRTYLGSYVSNHLQSILGDEYEEYVKYILSGKNEKFTLLDKKGNPYAYMKAPDNKNVFTYPITYRFAEGDEMPQKDEIEIEVPYLASKIVLLENLCPDTLVLVNYKRKHDIDDNNLVYHVSYDFQKKEMTYVNISDSTEFNFFLDVRNKENTLSKFKNYSFLLLINTRHVGTSAFIKDFDASFDLTATPVLNIENVAMLSIYNGDSPIKHNFNNTTDYIPFGSLDASYIQSATGFDVKMLNKSTSKQIINDHTYQIKTQYTLIIDQGQIKGMPTMKDSTVYTQTIENDIISGTVKITEQKQKFYKLNTFIDFVIGTDGDVEEKLVYSAYTQSIEDNTKTYWLEDFMSYMIPDSAFVITHDVGFGENTKWFITNNTAETQNVVSKIDANYKKTIFGQNGEVFPTVESRYLNTDFSNPDLRLNFVIRMSEE